MITIDQLIIGLFLIGILVAGLEEKKKRNKNKVVKTQYADFISFKID